MQTGSLFGSQHDTILSGVVFLWVTGSWAIAALIFFASIVVPAVKLMSLSLLLVSVQNRSTWKPHERTRLYRFVKFIGRWSMMDIYVAALLAALVQFGIFATVKVGPGAVAFGTVVVLTMLAAESFDPRLIWEPMQEPDEEPHQ